MDRRKSLKILGTIGIATLLPHTLLSAVVTKSCNVFNEAWMKLSKFTVKRYPFRYIKPIHDLPKVFIYGDSISIGYTEYVRASLEGKACVFRLHENGGASKDFIRKMESLSKVMFQPFHKKVGIFNGMSSTSM